MADVAPTGTTVESSQPMSHQASDGSLFRPTGRPLPVIGINTNQNLIHPGLFQGIVPGKDSLAKPPLAHTLVFKDVKKCEGIVKVLKKHTNQLLRDVHFLKECFVLLDEDNDGKLNRVELKRWIAIMTGSEQKDLPKTYKIDWDEDIDDLLQSLEISDLENHGGIGFDEFLLVMQDYYMAIGTLRVHLIFKDLIDPDMNLQRAAARRKLIEEGKDPDAADSDDRKDGLLGSDPEAGGGGAPAEGSPRAAEVTAAESGTGAGAEGEPRVEQQQHVGVKTRSCTIL